jgi:NTE family protein
VVAAALSAGHRPLQDRPPDVPDAAAGAEDADADGRMRRAAAKAASAVAATTAPIAPLALRAGAPAGALARAAIFRTARTGQHPAGLAGFVRGLDARFDGRLRVTALDKRRGKRVVFGAPGAPEASVADAVLASCAVPWMFAPVTIDGREYLDGGLWSPTNLDAAPAGRGTQVLCLMPTALRTVAGSPFGALRAVTRASALTEAQALRARGATVRMLTPDAGSARAMGPSLMNGRRRAEVEAAAYAQGLNL